MKKLLALSVVLFLSCSSSYTTRIFPLGTNVSKKLVPRYYLKDTHNEMQQMEGLWTYINGDSIFNLELKRFEKVPNFNEPEIFSDVLRGKYSFYVGENLIAQTIIDSTLSNKVNFHYRDTGNYTVFLIDVKSDLGKRGDFVLKSQNEASLKLTDYERIIFGEKQSAWSLPNKMNLTKQTD